MKIGFCIFHPAHVHNFKYLINDLIKEGHEVIIMASNKDNTFALLDNYKYKYIELSNNTGKNFFEKLFLFFRVTLKIYKISKKKSIEILVDRALPVTGVAAFLLKIPYLIFDDTEVTSIAWIINKFLASEIITPRYFNKDLGKKHIKIKTFKELFYLNENKFKPDKSKLDQLNLGKSQKYFILRFVSWEATHDIGHRYITDEEKIQIINQLEKYGKVFISSEKELSEKFQKYMLNVKLIDIHDIIYYSTLFIGEGGTMNTEACILGTFTINLCDLTVGSHEELTAKYQIMFSFREPNNRIQKTIIKINELMSNNNITELGKEIRKKILSENTDGNKFLMERILSYK